MVDDDRTVAVPTIDVISNDTFEHSRQQFHHELFAGRGLMSFHFEYKLFPLLISAALNPSKPFETPVMAGLFAIDAQFFLNELGAYDEELNTYGELKLLRILYEYIKFVKFSIDFIGGEQYELSLKIWLCGGRILETACSRVGHIFRPRRMSIFSHIKYNFISTVCICFVFQKSIAHLSLSMSLMKNVRSIILEL